MSEPHEQPPAEDPPPPPPPLYKQRSWSPDACREEAWLRRKMNSQNRRSKSVTDEDLDELTGFIELGFGFNSPEVELDRRLSDTLPALGLYHAVNKNYNGSLSKSTHSLCSSSECDTLSPLGSPHAIYSPGDNPQTVKMRLRQWARVVACTVRQLSS